MKKGVALMAAAAAAFAGTFGFHPTHGQTKRFRKYLDYKEAWTGPGTMTRQRRRAAERAQRKAILGKDARRRPRRAA